MIILTCKDSLPSISGIMYKQKIEQLLNQGENSGIEFISPGKLPNTVTIEKITKGVSYSRNPIILKFMQNMNYIDKLGRGLPMVIAEAKTLGKKVDFEESGEEFKVILYL